MLKFEQKFCTELQKWIKYNMKSTFCWEAKICEGKNLNYKNHFPEHQIRNLKICGRHFIYKISDADALCQKPFDGVSITEAPGYFFIQFKKPIFYIIEVSILESEIQSGSKSLTEQCAKKISYRIGELK